MAARFQMFAQWLLSGLLLAALAGCGANANLDAVHDAGNKSVMRYDQFQGATTNRKVIVAVAGGGTITVSENGARSWTRKIVDNKASLIGVTSCPDGSFVALDFYRKIWVGDAGAKTWSGKDIKTQANPLAVACDARNRIWVVGSLTTILLSSDKGATWNEKALGQDAMLTTVQFLSENQGIITGEFGAVYTTRDGGVNWEAGDKIPNDVYPLAALFKDVNTGWLAGAGGVILATRDGGKSWTRQNNKIGVPVYGFVEHGGGLYGVGANAVMLKQNGEDWTPVDHGKRGPYIRTALSLSPKELLLAGGAGLLEVVTLADAQTK